MIQKSRNPKKLVGTRRVVVVLNMHTKFREKYSASSFLLSIVATILILYFLYAILY